MYNAKFQLLQICGAAAFGRQNNIRKYPFNEITFVDVFREGCFAAFSNKLTKVVLKKLF